MKNRKHFGKVIATILSALLACFLLPQASASYVVEGTPTQKAVSDTVESTEPVCYIGSTFYTSIEGALAVAGSNTSEDTIYVIPGVTTTISKDCTIASGDSLVLPYSATLDESTNTYSDEVYTNGDDYTSASVKGFSDQILDSIGYYRKSLVIIDEDVTLTIDGGSLIVGGFTGYYTTGQAGSTSQDYCEILMMDDSSINVKNSGSITNYGYIRETTYIKDDDGNWQLNGSLENGSSVCMSADSTFTCPMVIYDFKGGSVTSMMIYSAVGNGKKTCPFELFDFPNIQVDLILNSSDGKTTAFNADYKFVVSGSAVSGTINVVAYSGAMVNLTSGSITMKYTPRCAGLTQGVYGYSSIENMYSGYKNGSFSTSERITYSTSNSNKAEDDDDCAYTTFTINGEAELNKIELGVTMTVSSISYTIDLDTSDFDLPISYRLRFVVGNGTDSSSLDVKYGVKVLPGSRIIVMPNAYATIEATLVFYPGYSNYEYTYWNSMNENSHYYPTGFDDPYLLNNGTITLGSDAAFGGTVHTTVAGAVFDARQGSVSGSSRYGKTYDFGSTDFLNVFDGYGNYSTTITQHAQGYIVSADGYTTTSITNFENKFYAGTSNPAGYWFETDPVNITWIVESNSNAVDDIAFSVNGMTVTYVNGTSSVASVQVGKGTTVKLGNVRGVSSFSVSGSTMTEFTASGDMTVTITPMIATATLNVNYVYSNATSKFSVVVSNGKVSLTVASLSLSSSGTYTYNCLEGETYSIEDTSYVKSVSPGETGSISSTTNVYVYGTTTHTLTVNHQGESFGLVNAYHAYPNYYLTYYKDNSMEEDTVYQSQSTSTYTVDEGTTVSITGFMTNTGQSSISYKRSYYINGLSTTAGSNTTSTETTFTYNGTDYTAITLTFTMTADATVSFSYTYS